MEAPPEKTESTTLSIVADKNKVEQFSRVHRICGFPWRLRVCNKGGRNVQLELVCDKSKEAELWQCSVRVEYNSWDIYEFNSWDRTKIVIDSSAYAGPKLSVKIAMVDDGIKWSCRPQLPSSQQRDGVLVIGEEKKKVKIHRKFLASQSPFFTRLFFDDYKEFEITELSIRDVDIKAFTHMINIVYGVDCDSPNKYQDMEATGLNVHIMLELAERFQLKIVEDSIVSFLLSSSSSIPMYKKIIISEQFNISFLKDNLLKQCTKSHVIAMRKSAEFDQLSHESLRVLFNKGNINAFPSAKVTSRKVKPIPDHQKYLVDRAFSKNESNISMVIEENNETEQISPVYRVSGFPWRLRIDRSNPYIAFVSLICDKSNEAALWKCTAKITSKLPDRSYVSTHTFTSWDKNSHEQRLFPTIAGAFQLEVNIETADDGESYCRQITHFEKYNGILVFGERKIYVNKESLASQSPFFDRLFFGDFAEKKMDEIPIGDVEYDEFSNMLAIMYESDHTSISCDNIENMLQLADRFEIKIVEDNVVSYLLSSSSSDLSLSKKLLISDQYNLPFLKDGLLPQFKSIDQLKEMSESPEWNQLSKETLRVLFKKFCI